MGAVPDFRSKIYVAGHLGLVGSAIMRKLQDQGFRNIITRTSKELDLTRQSEVERFFEAERPEYVFLAAAKVGGILANQNYPADFIYNNLIIEANVIHSAYLYRIKKLLFLGSSCIYPKFAPQPMKEEYLLTGLLEPTNEPYAVAKIAGLRMCQSYNRQYGTNFISLMPTNLYGPNDNFDLETSHVLAAMIRKFHMAKVLMEEGEGKRGEGRRSEKVVLWGTGSPRREFLHVDDLAEACLFLMERYNKSQIINIGMGQDNSIKELAYLIRGIVGFEGEILWDTSRPDGMPQKLLDTSKIRALGWTPKISLEDGLRMTYEWYKRFYDGEVVKTRQKIR